MPRKVRQLVSDLKSAGFSIVPTKSSHRKFRHASGVTIVISGQSGADTLHYQEKDLRNALAAVNETKT
jgi:predicted RNA binding protein YcfA (HicA-like mRNA interferase family)